MIRLESRLVHTSRESCVLVMSTAMCIGAFLELSYVVSERGNRKKVISSNSAPSSSICTCLKLGRLPATTMSNEDTIQVQLPLTSCVPALTSSRKVTRRGAPLVVPHGVANDQLAFIHEIHTVKHHASFRTQNYNQADKAGK